MRHGPIIKGDLIQTQNYRDLPLTNLAKVLKAKQDAIFSAVSLILILIGTILVLLITVFAPSELNNGSLMKIACMIFIILPIMQSFIVYGKIKFLANLAVKSAENYDNEFNDHQMTQFNSLRHAKPAIRN